MEKRFKDVKKELITSVIILIIAVFLSVFVFIMFRDELINYFVYLLIILILISLIITSYIKISRINRYKKYKEYIGNRKQVKVEELKNIFKKKKIRRLVVSDLEYYIKKGWFIQGHLVDIRRLLILDDVSYKKYMERMEKE